MNKEIKLESNTFGEVLKEIRMDRGLTQSEMAYYLNTSQPNISYIENTSNFINTKTIIDYARVLKFDVIFKLK